MSDLDELHKQVELSLFLQPFVLLSFSLSILLTLLDLPIPNRGKPLFKPSNNIQALQTSWDET